MLFKLFCIYRGSTWFSSERSGRNLPAICTSSRHKLANGLFEKSLFILALFFTVSFTSCNDDDNNDDLRVPNVNTDIDLNLNLPQYSPLQNPGSWVYVTGGSRGIIVYRVGIEDSEEVPA
jgi:hypothetical protein